MSHYYNDNDLRSCLWTTELIRKGLIPNGRVHHQCITKVTPDDLEGKSHCHFFNGISGWALSLRLAGWPENWPTWCASLPCQPFSAAGKQLGFEDERHLWPDFRNLVEQCQPPVCFGEQVASKAGRLWLSGVRSDLEALGYAVAASDLCAAGINAPHVRQRLYWVAYSRHAFRRGWPVPVQAKQSPYSNLGGLDHAHQTRLQGAHHQQELPTGVQLHAGQSGVGPWDEYEIVGFKDGTQRRIEPGTTPLAHGIPQRLVRLRGYGNAVVPQLAAEFVIAFREAIQELTERLRA